MDNNTATVSMGNVHKKRKNYSHAKANARLNRKRHEANVRQDGYAVLTVDEKISRVMKRREKGMGECKKELARLIKERDNQVEANLVKLKTKTVEVKTEVPAKKKVKKS